MDRVLKAAHAAVQIQCTAVPAGAVGLQPRLTHAERAIHEDGAAGSLSNVGNERAPNDGDGHAVNIIVRVTNAHSSAVTRCRVARKIAVHDLNRNATKAAGL